MGLSPGVIRVLKREREGHLRSIKAIDVLLCEDDEDPAADERLRPVPVPAPATISDTAGASRPTKGTFPDKILSVLRCGKNMPLDELVQLTGLTMSQVAPALTVLCRTNCAERTAPGVYRKVK